jgi:hypothetical protein
MQDLLAYGDAREREGFEQGLRMAMRLKGRNRWEPHVERLWQLYQESKGVMAKVDRALKGQMP